MGGKKRSVGGTAMRQILSLILFILFIIKPSIGLSSDYGKYLPNWLELLDKGNEKEKKVALNNLWILKYPEYRKDSGVFDPILKALKDRDASVREAAASYLKHLGKLSDGCCKETGIIPSLIVALEDSNPRVREEASAALTYYKDWQAIDPLIRRLKDVSPWVKLNAVFALGELKAPRVVDPLLDLLNDQSDWRNKFLQQECVIALRKIGHPYPRVITTLMKNFNDEYLKAEIIKTLGKFNATEARDLLVEASKDPNERIRKLAVEALSRVPGASPSRRVDLPQTIGKIGDSNVEVIVKSLNDPSPEVRAQSAEALGKLRDNRAVEPLLVALNDKDERVREKAVVSLSNFSDERIFDALINFILKDSNANLRNPAEKTFKSVAEKTCKEKVFIRRKQEAGQEIKSGSPVQVGRQLMIHPVAVNKLIGVYSPDPNAQVKLLWIIKLFWDTRIEEYVMKCLENPSPPVRQTALTLLDSYGSDKAVPRLIESLKDKDRNVRAQAARTLGDSKDKRALEPLIEKLNDSDDDVRAAALSSLRHYDDPRVLDLTIKGLSDPSISIRRTAVWNINEKPDRRATDVLILLLNDQDFLVASCSAEALGRTGDKKAVAPLIKAMKSEFNKNRMFSGDNDLRESAVKALGQIGDRAAVDPLIDVLKNDKNNYLRMFVAETLGNIGDERAIKPLENVLRSASDYGLKNASQKALDKITKTR